MIAHRSVTAIIQARMGSTRLPGKVLSKLDGVEVVERVINQVRGSKHIGEIVVATTTDRGDDELASFLKSLGVRCFRGSALDVLDRYYQVATELQLETVARITSDNPFVDPEILDQVIECYWKDSCDYATNTIPRTFPDGLDVEVFTYNALATAWKEASLNDEREHVTPFLRNRPERFKLGNVRGAADLSFHRWTLDTPDDFRFFQDTLEVLRSNQLLDSSHRVHLREVLRALELKPSLFTINNVQN